MGEAMSWRNAPPDRAGHLALAAPPAGRARIFVAPLALPEDAAAPDPTQISNFPAVRLFVERAAAPSFALTKDNAAAVTTICRRLETDCRWPSSCAFRVKVLSPAQLLATRPDAAAAHRRTSGPLNSPA